MMFHCQLLEPLISNFSLTKHNDCFSGPCNDWGVKQVPSHYTCSLSIVLQLKVINFLMSMNPLSVLLPMLSAFINQTDKPYLGGMLDPLLHVLKMPVKQNKTKVTS